MVDSPGPFLALVAVVGASAAAGTPFVRTATGRHALSRLVPGDAADDRLLQAAWYVGGSFAYAACVVLVGEYAVGSGTYGMTLSLVLPFAFGVAAATAWLPSIGLEWRPAGEAGVDATVVFAAFLATVTATAAGGWLLLG